MRNKSILLSILVLAAMVLAACGGGATSTNVASPPPAVTIESTETMDATEVPTMEGTATDEPGVPVTGEINPARVSNQLEFPVLSQDGQQIGEVDDLILDLDNRSVAYVLVTATGGSTVAVPWDSVTVQTGAGAGTGDAVSTPSGDATAAPETTATGEPTTGTATTEPAATEPAVTEPAATVDAGQGTGMTQQYAFVLDVDQEMLLNAPAFDPTTLPQVGETASDWDADIADYWQGGGMGTDSDTNTPSPDGTAVPEATATGSTNSTGTDQTQATATSDAGQGMSTDQGAKTGQGQALQGVLLASEVLGSTLTMGMQDSGTGTDQGQATADPNATTDPNATVAPEATATGDAGTGTSDTGTDQGPTTVTVEDLIVDTDAGDILYFVVNAVFTEGERWIPVPLNLFQWDAATGGLILNADGAMLQSAPSFDNSQFPDTSSSGWNSEFDSFWQNSGTDSGTGSEGTSPTATP